MNIQWIVITIMAVLGLAGMWTLRPRGARLKPIARDVVMEHIPEMVFVFDAHDRLLDLNTVAANWLDRTKADVLGRDSMDVFREWPRLLNRFLSTEQTREHIHVEKPGEDARVFEIVVTPIVDSTSAALRGRVILAHDVTEQKELQRDLTDLTEILWDRIAEVNALKAELQEQAIRDGLTGLLNRRFLSEALEKQVAQAKRENVQLSVVMIDVDHFKSFNDTYGHKCGDIILKDLASFLGEQAREGDFVCRYGGEEFVILMPNAAPQDAYQRAEAWRLAYAARAVVFNDRPLQVTFSAGVAGFPEHGTTDEAILHVADHALYASKNQGRNRVTLFNEHYLEQHAN